MAERDEFGAFLIGFVIGGLTGAAVALLLAPQSGEDTRVYLRDQAILLSDKAKETAQTTADQVGTRATDVYAKANAHRTLHSRAKPRSLAHSPHLATSRPSKHHYKKINTAVCCGVDF